MFQRVMVVVLCVGACMHERTCMHVCLFVCMSVCSQVGLSASLFVCLYVCLFATFLAISFIVMLQNDSDKFCVVFSRLLSTCGKYENINYMIVTQDPGNNSILGLHLGRGMVSSVRMVSLVRMVS